FICLSGEYPMPSSPRLYMGQSAASCALAAGENNACRITIPTKFMIRFRDMNRVPLSRRSHRTVSVGGFKRGLLCRLSRFTAAFGMRPAPHNDHSDVIALLCIYCGCLSLYPQCFRM